MHVWWRPLKSLLALACHWECNTYKRLEPQVHELASYHIKALDQEATFLPFILGLRAVCLHRGLQDSPACEG